MQTLCQETIAYHSENVVHYSRKFTANKLNFTWFLTLILGLDASTFRRIKGACSVSPFKGAYAVGVGYFIRPVLTSKTIYFYDTLFHLFL